VYAREAVIRRSTTLALKGAGMTAKFHNPVHIEFGPGASASLPNLLGGRKVALVTFPEASALGLVDRLRSLLGSAIATIIDRIEPNPDITTLAPLYAEFWDNRQKVDAIVAVGGGSTLDTAKALMIGTESGRFDELLSLLKDGRPFRPHAVKPLIAVPTTAGTGSEVTPWATIWDRDPRHPRKYSLHLDESWPQWAVIDPELMLTLPRSVTIQSGLDALSHALESIWNLNSNPISDALAISAARTVLSDLPALVGDLANLRLRESLALAALKAGLAFSNTKTALAHSISYEMTLRHGLPHGIACSFTLPMVLGRAIGIRADRDAVLAEIFGSLDGAAGRLTAFLEGLGVKTTFSSYGVTSDESEAMIRHALDGARGRNFIGVAA
jgi:phosphonate metabolism-associated iron-containing alcohol dehydrogenase